jgi:hypothetical protein
MKKLVTFSYLFGSKNKYLNTFLKLKASMDNRKMGKKLIFFLFFLIELGQVYHYSYQ